MNEVLLAAFDNDEKSIGLLLSDESGMYVRGDGHWFAVTKQNTKFDGANVVEVEEDFLDLYDKLETKGTAPTYSQAEAHAKDGE